MKILFLTDEFYPKFGANSLLVKTLAEEFVKNKHQVFVMPFAYEQGLSQTETWNGIEIVRSIPMDDKKTLLGNLKGCHFVSALKIGWKFVKQKFLKQEKILLKDRIAARKILEDFIRDNQIDAVISICCSIELSFPLLYLRKKNKLPCKWIFYMIDPFESHSYYRGIESVSTLRKIQHAIMESCDGVAATELIYNDTKIWESQEILQKIKIIEFPKIKKPIKRECLDGIAFDKEKINVICTGSKNELVRSSDYTLRLCKCLKDENIVFHFIGNGWCEAEKEISGNCIFYKERSHQAIWNIQIEADFLLNIGNVVVNQIPSKLLEYISTGKPIINVYKSIDCPTLNLLEDYEAFHICENENIDNAVKKLKEYVLSSHSGTDFSYIEKQYEIYTPSYVTEQFLRLLAELT